MEKIYDPKSIESKWVNFWKGNHCFVNKNLDLLLQDPTFCILLPPPNVTGNLHMGHAFQHTLIDLLIRFNRMRGKDVLWQVGLDHAGISTQMVVEKQLAAMGIQRTELTKEDFVNKVWEWKQQYGHCIINQMQRLGNAIDWSIGKFTLDPEFSIAVKQVFIQLYREGLIYKGKKLINWDPVLQTVISDLEVVNEEVPGNLWYIKYPLVGATTAEEYIVVATTRPETLFGDVAICVHPDDPRYQDIIGKKVLLPIVGTELTIIADPYVDQDFGTGCLKITPAHDANDYNLALKHNLPFINIFTKQLTLNNNVPVQYRGLDKSIAREKVLAELTQQNLLLKADPYMLKIPRSASTNSIVESLLTEQWFMRMAPLAEPAIAAVVEQKIKFVPEEWSSNYLDWLNNIQDWCISRQLWWGHQIPAWYDENNNIYVGEDEASIRKSYKLDQSVKLIQDPDVLDTWFSAALWPFVTLGWPDLDAIRFKKFFPTDLLITGFDIIFFWVARMVMLSLKFTGEIPFKTVYIHGIIQDQDGQKMSKSKGNVIDPLDLVDGISLPELLIKRTSGLMQPHLKDLIAVKTKQQFPQGISAFGVDPLRFTFCAIATNNRHIKFELSKLEGFRNFCNKLWNASRFVWLNVSLQDLTIDQLDPAMFKPHIATRWIVSIWQQAKSEVIKHITTYRFDLAAKVVYEFIWNEYCGWYLEFSKVILFTKEPLLDQLKINAAKAGLITILQECLRIMHPFMPYITEEIAQYFTADQTGAQNNHCLLDTIYPEGIDELADPLAEEAVIWSKKFITSIRNLRAKMKIPLGTILPQVFIDQRAITTLQQEYLLAQIMEIKTLTKVQDIVLTDQKPHKPLAVITLVDQAEVWFYVTGVVESNIGSERLSKEINKLNQQLAITNKKLSDPGYLAKAPAAVVAKEQLKQTELMAAIKKLQDILST